MDKALLARVEHQAWFHKYPRGLPFALLCLGLFFTVYLVSLVESAENREAEFVLDRSADAVASAVQRRADENVAYLTAAASLFEADTQASDNDLESYTEKLSSTSGDRGAVGIGWATWIPTENTAAFEATMQALHPENAGIAIRPYYTPARNRAVITFILPQTEANRRVIGFDMYSEAVRREAMDGAIASKRPTLSGMVNLMQDNGHASTPSSLLYVPVFSQGIGATDTGARPLRGFVYAPIRAGEFLNAALRGVERRVGGARLYDGKIADNLLLASVGVQSTNKLAAEKRIKFGGREWIIVAYAPSHPGLTLTSRIIAFSGSVISLLLMAIAWYMTSRAADDRKVLDWLTAQAEIRTSLARELNHRVKNTLANVLSIVALTHRKATDLDSFVAALSGRLRALSATHDLLSERNWKDAPVADVVRSEIAPYLGRRHAAAEFDGPEVLLAPNDALSLGLALHELATNAAKYGALSVADGHVAVSWKLINPDLCEVHWEESGGPAVREPKTRGFGTDLIEKIVGQQLRQKIVLEFRPSGVVCTIPVPVRVAQEFEIRSAKTRPA